MRLRGWICGNALLTVGLLWVALHRALVSMYPLSWGGPNIGAGFITVLAYGAIAVGLGRIIGELSATRRGRREGNSTADASTHRSALSWWLPPAISTVVAVACAVLIAAPPGVRGASKGGAVGVTVDASGPVLVLVVCEHSVDTVTLFGPNRGSVPNEKVATLSAPAGGISRTTLLPLLTVPSGWTGGPVLPLQRRPTDPVIAFAQGGKTYLAEVSFTAADLSALTPSDVRLDGGRTVALKDVSAVVCG